MAGSVLMLVAILWLYFLNRSVTGVATFDLLAFYPTTLFGRSNHRAHRCDGHFDDPLVVAATILVILRDVVALAVGPVIGASFSRPNRRNVIVEADLSQVWIFARLQHHTAAAESGILTYLPIARCNDRGRSPVIEPDPVHVPNRTIGSE